MKQYIIIDGEWIPVVQTKHLPGKHEQATHGNWAADIPDTGGAGPTRLMNKIMKQGGITYRVLDSSSPQRGYAMSPYPDAERKVSLSNLTPATIKRYIADHAHRLKKANTYLGAWIDGDDVYLDISVVLSNLTEAMRQAKTFNQLAIYDLGSGQTLDTGIQR